MMMVIITRLNNRCQKYDGTKSKVGSPKPFKWSVYTRTYKV